MKAEARRSPRVVSEQPPDLAKASAKAPAVPEVAALEKVLAGYLQPDDIAQIHSAYLVAKAAHDGQLRYTGEPYTTHPTAVANILAEWHLEPPALRAAPPPRPR